MKEIFKQIQFTNGIYEVSNIGNVKRANKILNPIAKNNYNSVSISLNGVVKVCYVHRLVASAFIENPFNKPQVNHINGIRTDNRVENLEWCTNSENTKHSFEKLGRVNIGLKGSMNGMYNCKGNNNKYSKPVICSNGKTYESRKEAARELNINAGNITLICNGQRKTIKGFSFVWAK